MPYQPWKSLHAAHQGMHNLVVFQAHGSLMQLGLSGAWADVTLVPPRTILWRLPVSGATRMCGLTCQNTEIQAHDKTLREGLTAEPLHRVTAQKKDRGDT